MKEKLIRFMQGRYGVDQFTKFLSTTGLVLLLLNIFFNSTVLYVLGLAIFIYAYVRMFSKNHQRRFAENQKYLQMTNGFRSRLRKQSSYMQQRKSFHIYSCPSCRQKIRVPKGRGKIEISCPKCQAKFIKKS